jgi:hypothetical protein
LLRVRPSRLERLPAKIPVHFGIDGTPDRHGDKAEGLLIFLLAPVLLTWFCTAALGSFPSPAAGRPC